MQWKISYEWPKGVSFQESLVQRNRLEASIKEEIEAKGWLSKKVFDDVMVWGFGRPSNNTGFSKLHTRLLVTFARIG